MSDRVRKFSNAVERTAAAIKCECGGHAERDHNMTVAEIDGRSCGRDTETYQCCARAFVCAICGTRWLGVAEAPEME